MKIDLHRHFGGSIEPETVIKIQQNQPELKGLVSDIDRLRQIMTFEEDDTHYNFQRFLQKFQVLNHIRWDEQSIDMAVEQVARSLKEEGIDYSEIRFSIDKYLNHVNWDEVECTLFFLDRLRYWSKMHSVEIGPVLCMKYETPKKQAMRLSKMINHWRIAEQLVGIDFVSDEAFFDSGFLSQICRFWRMCNKQVLAHVGETQSAENVRKAIVDLRVTRVAHGIAAAEDEEILKLAADYRIPFDISLSSNLMTGVVKDLSKHPVRKMYDAGVIITIGTDDPVQFRTNIDKEYQLLQEVVGFSEAEVEEIKRNSLEASGRDPGKHW